MESACKDMLCESDPTLAQASIILSNDGFLFGSSSMIFQQSSLALLYANCKINWFLVLILIICFSTASCSLSTNCRYSSLTPLSDLGIPLGWLSHVFYFKSCLHPQIF